MLLLRLARFHIMLGIWAMLLPAVLDAQTQTTDSAVQLGAGFSGTGLPGLTPAGASGGGYPLLFSAPLFIALQPAVVWTPTVSAARLSVTPPELEATHAVPMTDSDRSSGWHAMTPLAVADADSIIIASTPAYAAAPVRRLGIRSAGFADAEEPADSGLAGSDEGLGDEVSSMASSGMGIAQVFSSSCLDSPSGCGGMSLTAGPTISVSTPSAVRRMSVNDAMLPKIPVRHVSATDGRAKSSSKRSSSSAARSESGEAAGKIAREHTY